MTPSPVRALNPADFPDGTLALVRDLFTRLNDEGVRYCHWKSTTTLPKALAGGTDLDLLVHREDASRFAEVVQAQGFKPFVSHPSRRFPSVEDRLGYDVDSGRLVHLHIYYRLIVGEQYVKNHVLPIERAFLEATELRHGVRVPVPAAELLVLIVRSLLKYRDTDAVKDFLRVGHRGGVPPETRAEIGDLAARASPVDVVDMGSTLLPGLPAAIIRGFLETMRRNRRDARSLVRLRNATRRALRSYERLSPATARAQFLRARLSRAPLVRLVARGLRRADMRRKSPAVGGVTVAIVGPDGAGKSTIIGELQGWLGWRLNIAVAYLGTARPSSLTAVVQNTSRVTRRVARRLGSAGSGGPAGLAGWLDDILAAVRYLAEARDRAVRAREGRRLAANGALVLFDRYPLPYLRLDERHMDGPRIGTIHRSARSGLLASLRRREESIYRGIAPPDLTILLVVPPDVALSRKPSIKPQSVVDKSRAIRAAASGASTASLPDGIVAIDASQPLPEVLDAVRAEIWRRL